MAFVDLHIHSSHSLDGEFPPERLVADAAGAGIAWMALTDHNSVAGVDKALEAGLERGVHVIPAVELDCAWEGMDLHLLGYGIEHHDRRFVEAEADALARERAISQQRVELIREMGIQVDQFRLDATARQGIAIPELVVELALLDPRNDAHPLLLPYRPGGNRSDNPLVNFWWDHCSRGQAAFVEQIHPPLAWAIELVVSAGGVPVLAHPGQNFRGREEKADTLFTLGVRGVEAFSSYHSPEMAAYWVGTAERHDAGFTCGSDFHGKTKPAIKLGGHGGDDHEKAVIGWLADMGMMAL